MATPTACAAIAASAGCTGLPPVSATGCTSPEPRCSSENESATRGLSTPRPRSASSSSGTAATLLLLLFVPYPACCFSWASSHGVAVSMPGSSALALDKAVSNAPREMLGASCRRACCTPAHTPPDGLTQIKRLAVPLEPPAMLQQYNFAPATGRWGSAATLGITEGTTRGNASPSSAGNGV